jgi:hypothetical protein
MADMRKGRSKSKRKERMSLIMNDHKVKQIEAKEASQVQQEIRQVRQAGLVSRRARMQSSEVDQIREGKALSQRRSCWMWAMWQCNTNSEQYTRVRSNEHCRQRSIMQERMVAKKSKKLCMQAWF